MHRSQRAARYRRRVILRRFLCDIVSSSVFFFRCSVFARTEIVFRSKQTLFGKSIRVLLTCLSSLNVSRLIFSSLFIVRSQAGKGFLLLVLWPKIFLSKEENSQGWKNTIFLVETEENLSFFFDGKPFDLLRSIST